MDFSVPTFFIDFFILLLYNKKMIVKEDVFYNLTKGRLTFEEVVKEILDFIQENPNFSYEVIVGCDSSSGKSPSFPLVIVVLRKGNGGRFFFKKIHFKNRVFHHLRERILQEVFLSCELALLLRENLEKEIKKIDHPFSWEFKYIHTDISETGLTKDMIREVVALIKSNGFEAKIKPESFAASVVADRYT